MELLPTPSRPAPDDRALAAALGRSLSGAPDRAERLARAVEDADPADRGARAVGVTVAAASSGLTEGSAVPDVRSDALSETLDGLSSLAEDSGAIANLVAALEADTAALSEPLEAADALDDAVPAVLAGDVDGALRSTLTDALGGDHDADGLAALVALHRVLGSEPVLETASALLDQELRADVEATLERARTELADRLRSLDDPDAGRQPPDSGTTELQPVNVGGQGAEPVLPPETAWVRALRGELAAAGGDHAVAHEQYATAIESLTAAGETVDAAVCRGNLALVYRALDEHDAALAQYEAANEEFRGPTVQERRAGAVCTVSLGEGALDADQVAQAEGYLGRAREDFADADDPWGEARCLVALAKTAIRRGDATDAAEEYRDALGLYDRLGDDRGRAVANVGLGTVARSQDVDEDPETLFTAGLTAAQRVGDHETVGAAAVSFGELASERGDRELASEHFERALAAFRAAGDESGEATCLHNLGRVAQEAGDTDGARERFEAAREAFRDMGDEYAAARSVDRLGELERADTPERALQRFQTAADTFLQLGAVRDALPTLSSLVEVAIETGETETAREYCETALELLDRAGLDEQREHFERLEDRIASGS